MAASARAARGRVTPGRGRRVSGFVRKKSKAGLRVQTRLAPFTQKDATENFYLSLPALA